MKKTEAKQTEPTPEEKERILGEQLNDIISEIIKILESIPDARESTIAYRKAEASWTESYYNEKEDTDPFYYWAKAMAFHIIRDPEELESYSKDREGYINVPLKSFVSISLDYEKKMTYVLERMETGLKYARELGEKYSILRGLFEELDHTKSMGPFKQCPKGQELDRLNHLINYIADNKIDPKDQPKTPQEVAKEKERIKAYFGELELLPFRKRMEKDGKPLSEIDKIDQELEEVLPRTIRGQTVYKDNTKVGFLLGQAPTLEDFSISATALVDRKKTKVPFTVKSLEYNRPLEPYDLLIQGAIGSIIENNLKNAGTSERIKIYPATVYRVLADLPDEPANKGNASQRSRERTSKDVSEKDLQEIIERIDQLMATTGTINIKEQKENWPKLKKMKTDVLTGQLFQGYKVGTKETTMKDGKPVLDKNGKPKERWTGVYYLPTDYPLVYRYAKWTEQVLTSERGKLDTTVKGVKGLKNPDGTPFQPIRNTRDITILKQILETEVRNMERERAESPKGHYENRRNYTTILELTYGKGRPESKKEGKPLITFKKNVGKILDFFRASGIIQDWKRYPDDKGKTTKYHGVKIFLNPPQDQKSLESNI